MRCGGRTPEELETLLEDACIARNLDAMLSLFHERAVLVHSAEEPPARGGEEIARAATALLRRRPTYVADPGRVIQVGDVALSVGGGINVLRRGSDGAWRFVIALLHIDRPDKDGDNHD